MKKYLLLTFALLIFTGSSFAQDKKVAVVSFYSDKIIGFKDLGIGSEGLITAVADLKNNPDFDLTSMLEKFHDKFFNSYAEKLPFELLPESDVINNEDYKNFNPKWDKSEEELTNYVVYPGYKYIYEGFAGKENEEGVAKIFSDTADGVLFTEIHFGLKKGFGIGGTASVKMNAFVRMALYNKKGEKVVVINESATSKKSGMMVGGIPVMSPKKIIPMCESALERLMIDLDNRLEKVAKKAAKKL